MITTAPKRSIDKLRISDDPSLDRRRKLTEAQRAEIRKKWWDTHEAERPTMTALGEEYNVHRTAIAGILYPERDERQRAKYKQRAKDGRYYDSEKARKNLKNCREYKLKLLQEGKLSM